MHEESSSRDEDLPHCGTNRERQLWCREMPYTLTFNRAAAQGSFGESSKVPCLVQELALPALCNGESVVLAAETGSGKTMAYLAPLIASLLRTKEGQQDGQDALHLRPVTDGSRAMRPC